MTKMYLYFVFDNNNLYVNDNTGFKDKSGQHTLFQYQLMRPAFFE